MTAVKQSPERTQRDKDFIKIETDQKQNIFTFQDITQGK